MNDDCAVALALAKDLLSGSVDRIDGLSDLGRLISACPLLAPAPGQAGFEPSFGLLIHVSDELDVAPGLAQRALWDAAAFEHYRTEGEEILRAYEPDITGALELVVARLSADA